MAPSSVESTLHQRAGGSCELCGAQVGLTVFAVPPVTAPDADRSVLACPTCVVALTTDQPLDARHLRCLQQAAWSEVPAVQVVSWRLLGRLADEPWAIDLREKLYLDEGTLLWANELGEPEDEAAVKTTDSFGTALAEGDTVTLVKDLDVKGASFTAKRGTVVRNIHLTDNPAHVEGRVNGVVIVLKTEFLKKVV